MSNFVFVYYKDPGGPAPDDSVMKAWENWYKDLGENLVDGGGPFNDNGMAVEKSGVSKIENHPSVGYTIVKASSMDEATEMAKGSPMLDAPGGAVRVYETLPM